MTVILFFGAKFIEEKPASVLILALIAVA